MSDLTHFSAEGRPRMVDVSAKPQSGRIAVATGRVLASPHAVQLATTGQLKKGDVRPVAELAGIMAAKRTSELIPLCHPLALTGIEVSVDPTDAGFDVTARVRTTGQTGVEMEALTAVSVACLTIYDMLKAVDKSMTIEAIRLEEKSGGASGDYRRLSV